MGSGTSEVSLQPKNQNVYFSLNIPCHQLLHLKGHGAVGAAHDAQDGAGVVELVTRLLT